MGAEVRIGLSEFEAIKDARKKAEEELKEAKQTHKEEISDLKSTIKDLENKSRVIIKHKDKYFYKTAFDTDTIRKIKNKIANEIFLGRLEFDYLFRDRNMGVYDKMYKITDIIIDKINDSDFIQPSENEIKKMFSENGDPDQYIGFDDIKLEVERELKDQYINNQKKIQENLEQQIKDYENKYQKVDEELRSKHSSRIKLLEDKLNNSQEELDDLKETHKEEVNKLKETHKEEVDKLKEELKEAQKTQAEKILDAEEKLKEAQEVLKKLTNTPSKKWYEFWK
jgi:predicted  nucleic acid-binding Zn-ribbon protein